MGTAPSSLRPAAGDGAPVAAGVGTALAVAEAAVVSPEPLPEARADPPAQRSAKASAAAPSQPDAPPRPDKAPQAATQASGTIVDSEAALIARLEAQQQNLNAAGEYLAANELGAFVRPVRLREGVLEVALAPDAPADLAGRLGEALSTSEGQRWYIALSSAPGFDTLAERRAAAERALAEKLAAHPTVAAALATFPGAKISAIRPLGPQDRPEMLDQDLAADDMGAYDGVLLDDEDAEDEED